MTINTEDPAAIKFIEDLDASFSAAHAANKDYEKGLTALDASIDEAVKAARLYFDGVINAVNAIKYDYDEGLAAISVAASAAIAAMVDARKDYSEQDVVGATSEAHEAASEARKHYQKTLAAAVAIESITKAAAKSFDTINKLSP